MPVAVPLISAGIGAAGAVASSRAQSSAAKSAANASQQATDQTIAEQRRQYDLSRADQQPWLTTGTSALNQLAGLYGLNTSNGSAMSQPGGFNEAAYLAANPDVAASIQQGGFGGSALNHYNEYGISEGRSGAGMTPTTGTPSAAIGGGGMKDFFTSPDYQFRQDEQMRALTARNAALGIQDSGAAQKSALTQSGNLASGEFNNYANRLASLAGVGQTAANNTAQLGQGFANNFGNAMNNNAQNLASSYATQGAAQGQLYGQLGGMASGLVGQFGGMSNYIGGGRR